MPGALTHGDVDLQLRVPAPAFSAAVALLRRTHPVVHPEIWAATLATVTVPREAPGDAPTGLAVTPTGSEHDVRFTDSWRLLAADRRLVEEHHARKVAADGPEAPPTRRAGPPSSTACCEADRGHDRRKAGGCLASRAAPAPPTTPRGQPR